jgi:hypothetical protein
MHGPGLPPPEVVVVELLVWASAGPVKVRSAAAADATVKKATRIALFSAVRTPAFAVFAARASRLTITKPDRSNVFKPLRVTSCQNGTRQAEFSA